MSKRIYRSREQWRSLVSEYQLKYSGESKSSFCRKRGLSATTFCKWYKKFSGASKFIEVKPKIQVGYLKVFGLNLIKLELGV